MTPSPVAILLVDDEPRNLDSLEAILDDPGYLLLRSENADSALRQLLEHEVAAIVLDIKMPGVSGFDLAQLIKGSKRFRQIPIVFLTAYMMDEQDQLAGYGAGAVDYLTKPFNPQILRQKIAVFVELYRKTRALAELNDTLEARVRERTAELEKSEAALHLAARQKDEFLAILAHELRNPLAPLRTGLDLLLRVKPALPAVDRTLQSMNRQLDHMVRLIDDLLDVSRINCGKLELQKDRADLATIIDRAIDGSATFFARRKQTITADIPRAVAAVVDSVRIVQILGNLLHNASKFTPEGGNVRVELAYERGIAQIRVIDSGIGIPAGQIERVFEMFARIERPNAGMDRGLGIGLGLSRRLAQMHGGTLEVASEGDGHGATFTLSLPAFERPAEMTTTTAERISLGAPASPLGIVVIEDGEDTAMTLGALLELCGHRVTIAHDGRRGVELVKQTRPDVVLCDLGLPELDGTEVCRMIRKLLLEHQPVMVAVTGWGRDDDRRRTKDAGFDHHVVKPVAWDRLEPILREVARTNAVRA